MKFLRYYCFFLAIFLVASSLWKHGAISTSPLTVILTVFAGAVLLVLASKALVWVVGKGWRLMGSGHYDEAIAYYSSFRKKNVAVLFNLAVSQHRKGDLAAALSTLDHIDISALKDFMRPHYHALVARTLIMAGRDYSAGERHHDLALSNGPVPWHLADVLLYKSYVACLQGNIGEARPFVAQYLEIARTRKCVRFAGGMAFDWQYGELIESYLLGFFYWKDGQFQEARGRLKKACQFPYPDLYSSRARELLAALPLDDKRSG